MKILALEFSSALRSVAVVEAHNEGLPPVVRGAASATGPGALSALSLVDRALRDAGLKPDQVECLAIGLGPGSYTGIRSAIALAQGWQLARPVQLLGISSVECLAAQTYAEGWRGHLHVVIDAQRNEFYVAEYDLPRTGWRLVQPLRLARPEQDLAAGACAGQVVGPEATQWFPGGRIMFPSAVVLGQLAAGRNDFVAGHQLEPIYLRIAAFVKAPPPRVLPD